MQADGAPGRGSIASNALSLLTARGAGAAVAFLFGIYIARSLGVREFGGYSVLMAYYTLLSIFVHLGMDSLIVREISRSPGESRRYFGGALRVKIASALACLLLLAVLPSVLPVAAGLGLPLLLIGGALILDALSDAVTCVFQAHERFREPSLLALGGGVLFAILGSVGLLQGGRTTTLLASLVAAKAVQGAAGWTLLRRRLGPQTPVSPTSTWRFSAGLLASAAPFFVAKLLAVLYLRIDMLMLGAMAGESSVGLYAAAYKFVNVSTAAAASFSAALFPAMTAAGPSDPARLQSLLRDSVKYLVVAGALVSALTWILCADLLTFLFGEEFIRAAPAARVLAWSIVAIFVNLILSNALLAMNRERYAMLVGGAALAVNVGLNLVLIPRYREAGAAAATLAAEAAVLAASAICLLRAGALRLQPGPVLRFLACGLALVAPALVAGRASPAIAGAAGAALFFASLIALRIVTLDDLGRLRGYFVAPGRVA